MSDAALRRTIRRSAAAVLLPACSLAIGAERYVWSDTYGASPDGGLIAAVVVVLPWLLLSLSVGYLASSLARQMFTAPLDGSDARSDEA
ncbi:hypothetical protein Hbl1158_10400 [Halobaculum sp. CBA1158]|uniref:hypothetical protein n=1 Tax=Halobaculum sp. CBA1158 TaxID=2904243 RepID=UPI001F2B3560|nr:hypothetical protein [Halobaculum sp. CBA1158]UIO98945.1 hypothetical protein Hbl1158_10400 [Halobaculum sp. CBA1158]